MNTNNKYVRFFLQAPRLNSKKQIALVRGELFAEFIATVAADESLDGEYRAFLICAISGGLRVEEALSLKKTSFQVEGGVLYFQSTVLKKRRIDKRWCRVHPAGQTLVQKVISEKVGPLFDWTQNTALVRAKKTFAVEGVCNHSFRHSAVSYFLFTENLSVEKTAKLVHVTSKIIDTYAHLDERRTLNQMFK